MTYTKVIGETVAMGLDNDCTAASAGSIFGAAYGLDAIPEHWTRNFNNKVLFVHHWQPASSPLMIWSIASLRWRPRTLAGD